MPNIFARLMPRRSLRWVRQRRLVSLRERIMAMSLSNSASRDGLRYSQLGSMACWWKTSAAREAAALGPRRGLARLGLEKVRVLRERSLGWMKPSYSKARMCWAAAGAR